MVLDKAEVEKELEISKKKLEEQSTNKDKFFSIISHDLKNPLGTILNTAEFFNEEYDNLVDHERKELVNIIKTSSENLYELLEGLLDWSRARMGSLEFIPQKVNLYILVSEIFQLVQYNADIKEINLTNNIDRNLLVLADKNMINLILRNLISNAVKFSRNGGSVKILSDVKDNEIIIIVQDNGIGISEKDQKKLFRIEVHHTSIGTNNEPGTGVGLILCKELVEKHGGKIWVESQLRKGSKFMFSLPKSTN